MQVPSWFDQSYYLSLKLAQVRATDPSMTMFNLEKAIADGGMTPYQHFVAYGAAENLSPNGFFNVGEYLQAKANQLNLDAGAEVYTAASVLSAFEKAGVSPWQHYVMYGSAEGVNPSNAFDENAYLTLKLNQLKIADPEKWGKFTEKDVRAAFEEQGLTALDHYLTYGKNEALVSDESQLATKNPVPPAPVNPVETKLTEEMDTLTGTTGNDLFTGTAKTWTPGDSINGGTGYDTLRLQSVETISNGTQTVNGVEHLEVANVGTADVTADVSHFTGLEKVSFNGAKDVDLNLADSVTDVNLSGVNGTTVDVDGNGVSRLALTNVKDGNAVVTLNNTTANHNLTLVLDKVGDVAGKNGVTVTDAEAVSLTVVTGGASAVDLDVAKAKTINVAGTADLYIGNDLTGNALESINASAQQGGLTIGTSLGTGIAFTGGTGSDDVTVDATTKSILTGKGNDTVRLSGSALGTGGLVDGGDGRDTLGMSFANAAAVVAGFTNQVKGFETLHVGGNIADGATIDMSLFAANNAIDTVVVDASSKDFAITNLADKSTVQLAGNMGEPVTLQVKDAGAVGHNNDILNLTLGTDKAGASVAGLVVTDLEVLNVLSQGGANTIGGLSGLSSNGTVTIKGDANLSITTGDMGVAATFDATGYKGALTLDASANSRAVKVTGGDGNDTITGGAGKDVIIGGAGNDTIKSSGETDTFTGGLGEDTFTYTVKGHSVAGKLDTITDFKHGEDTLDLSAIGAKASSEVNAVQVAVKALAANATLADALNAAANANSTANGVVWFEFDSKTYVYHEATSGTTYNAGDLVVELTGTNLGLAADDFTFA